MQSSKITGPLQAKIMLILREEALSGVDIMKRLRLSPGTIYPVLSELRNKRLVNHRIEKIGTIQKKIYFLTDTGRQQIREYLVSSARMFCCDASLHLKRILQNVNELIEIKRDQKVFATLKNDEVEHFLASTDATTSNITYSDNLNVPSNSYDVALSFLGVGCLMGNKILATVSYIRSLYKSLKKEGVLLAIEIEKTDNIFAKMLFQDIVGLKEMPGLERDQLNNALHRAGFTRIKVINKSGILYAISHKK
jgi:DNA-binding PadR family transcriptional regulator